MTVLKMKWCCRIIIFVLVFLNVEVLCKNERSDLPRCHLESGILKNQDLLKDTVKEAQYVFSGRVAGEALMNDDGSVHFKVQVKRVMKGTIVGDVDLIRPGASNENCTLVVRNRQTLIFIAQSDANGGVILPVNPLRLNLATLDKINAAVKGVAYTPSPPIIEEPCERKYCAWNADCFPTTDFDTEPSGAYCKCPESCPAGEPSYVCGTDGVTYTSRCELRKISCNKHLELRIRHYGKCEGVTPCDAFPCGSGSECVLNSKGNPECRCLKKCSAIELYSGPVCGTDARDYPSACDLHREVCIGSSVAVVKYNGTCDPCTSISCTENEVCILDDKRKPQCSCGQKCTPNDTSVCASDGRSYQNECEMQQEACRSGVELRIIYTGDCESGVNPCESVTCSDLESCHINKSGVPACSCGPICPAILRPVCSHTGQTFTSMCEMLRHSCLAGEHHELKHEGACDACDSLQCEHYSKCEKRGGSASCVCPEPCRNDTVRDVMVCGIDGKNYSNECELQRASCQAQQHNVVAYRGDCDLCLNVQCKFGARCLRGECICPTDCTTSLAEPVCGSNGVTYSNECELQQTACEEDTDEPLTVLYYSSCDDKKLSKHKTVEPCAALPFGCCSDGITPAVDIQASNCDAVSRLLPLESSSVDSYSQTLYKSLSHKSSRKRHPCECHPRGSLSLECSKESPRCKCKAGVEGHNCDQCKEGYWGLHIQGHDGCAPCSCDPYGSLRFDCNQSSGQCMCKTRVRGRHCDVCPSGEQLGTRGCTKQKINESSQPLNDDPVLSSKSTRHLLAPELRYYYANHLSPINNDDISSHAEASFQTSPVTVRVIVALLGDLCEVDGDCGAPGSVCRQGACLCPPGTKETVDRRECKVSGFYDTPSFNGKSYLRLKPLKAYHKLSIELDIKAYAPDGVIIFDQQHLDGKGDFVALSLVNGYIEFRYDLGDGLVVLSSQEKLSLHEFHTISARRYQGDGWLKTGDAEPVTGKSSGQFKSLDLTQSAYIGRVPSNYSRVYKNIGTTKSFVGCIRNLKINGRVLSLGANDDSELSIEATEDISQCGHAHCANNPCGAGTCKEGDGPYGYRCICPPYLSGYQCSIQIDPCQTNPCHSAPCEKDNLGAPVCRCPIGRHGQFCQHVDINVKSLTIPEFKGSQYIRMPPLTNAGRTFTIEIWFLTYKPNGLLLYTGQKHNGRGDFVSINIMDSHIQFRYNLGSGIANITSSHRISLGSWHRVVASRDGRHGALSVDGGPAARGSSLGTLKELNLEMPLYIGAVPSWSWTHALSGCSVGLRGALQRVLYNGNPLDVLAVRNECHSITDTFYENSSCSGSNLGVYKGLPCSSDNSPCLNGGTCLPLLNDYVCSCKNNYKGKHCEILYQPSRKHQPKISHKIFEEDVLLNNNDSNDVPRKHTSILNESDINYTENTLEAKKAGNKQIKPINENVSDDLESVTDSTNILKTKHRLNNKSLGESKAIRLKGDSYFAYRNKMTKIRSWSRGIRYTIEFKTKNAEGLLFWRNRGGPRGLMSKQTMYLDFLGIAIVNGKLQLSYGIDVDGTLKTLETNSKIHDERWHVVHIRRRKNMVLLQLDDAQPIRGHISSNPDILLRPNPKLWIGGAPSLPSGLHHSYYIGFSGCIKSLRVNSRLQDLSRPTGVVPPNEYCHQETDDDS